MGEVIKTKIATNTNVWQPPRGNVIKINFDASFNQNYHRSISGIIARNKEGLVMASCTYLFENTSNPTMAEARACLQAMAEEIGFRDICVEGDALTIIRKLISVVEDRSCIRSLIQEIKGRTSKFRTKFAIIDQDEQNPELEWGKKKECIRYKCHDIREMRSHVRPCLRNGISIIEVPRKTMSGTWHGHRYENSHVRPYLGYGICSTGNIPCKTMFGTWLWHVIIRQETQVSLVFQVVSSK
ncbi:hypothetical protein Gotur_003347 [Gossypium turneri]